MTQQCDNKSVGILVWDEGKLLMIERKKYNFGFALPAGHQDGDDSETAARKELAEEVGLDAESLEKKLTLTLPNPCKREGGSHHEWTIFETAKWSGKVKPSADEAKGYLWADRKKLVELSRRLEEFAAEINVLLNPENLPRLVKATNEIISWRKNPGLEPPMYFLFKKLGII